MDWCLALRGDGEGLLFRVLSTFTSGGDRCFVCAVGFSGLLSDDAPPDSESDSEELLEELSSELEGLGVAFGLLFSTCFLSFAASVFFTPGFGRGVSRVSLGDLTFCLLSLMGDFDAVILLTSLAGLRDCSCLRRLCVSSMGCLSSSEGDRCLRTLLSSLEELRLRLLSSGVTARLVRSPSRLSPLLETTFSLCSARRCPSSSRESLLLDVTLGGSGLELDLRRLLAGFSSAGSWRRTGRFSSDGVRALRCCLCFLVSGVFSAELERSARRCCLSRASFSGDGLSRVSLWRCLDRSSLTRSLGEWSRCARGRP